MIGVGTLGLLQFAEDNRSSIPQARDNGGVLARSEIAMDRHTMRGWYTFDPTEILDRHRHAVKGTSVLARRDFLFGQSRFGERRVRHDKSVTLKLAIYPFNAIEKRLCHFNRRQLFGVNALSNLEQPEVMQIRRRHRLSPLHPTDCSLLPRIEPSNYS